MLTYGTRPWVYSLDDPDCARKGRFSCYFEAWSACPLRAAADDENETHAAGTLLVHQYLLTGTKVLAY
jgi:hypothetical protein